MIRNTYIYNSTLRDFFPRIYKNVSYQRGRAACCTSCILNYLLQGISFANNLYWLTKLVLVIRFCIACISLGIYLPLWRGFILKLPSKNISLSRLISSRCLSKHDKKLILFGGQVIPTKTGFVLGNKISKNMPSTTNSIKWTRQNSVEWFVLKSDWYM